nr:hypothetical protein [Tanacetum cinerariifolium]
MVAHKPTAKRDEQKKPDSVADKPKKPTPIKKPTPAKQMKPMKEKSTKPSPLKKADKCKVKKVQNGKSHTEPEPQVENEEYDLQRGKGKGIATDEQAILSLLDLQKKSTTDQFLLQRRTPATDEASTGPYAQPKDDTFTNIVCEEQGEDMSNKVDLEERIAKINEGQAGSNSSKTPESRPPPKRVLIKEDQAGPNPRQSHVAFVGPDPEPMHDEFVSIVYPQVHESLKHTTEKHVHLENPLSSSGDLHK